MRGLSHRAKSGPYRPALAVSGAGNKAVANVFRQGDAEAGASPDERADTRGQRLNGSGGLWSYPGSALLPPGGGSPGSPHDGPAVPDTPPADPSNMGTGQATVSPLPDFLGDSQAITQSSGPLTLTSPAPVVSQIEKGDSGGEGQSAEARFGNIQRALGIAAIGFLEAGRLLLLARAEADYAALGMPDWEAYLDDLGLTRSHASRLMAVARMVQEKGLPIALAQQIGETRLYYAHLALKRGQEIDLSTLGEKGCHELRASLGYAQDEQPRVWACGHCGAEIEVCPQCHAAAAFKCHVAAKKKSNE